MPFLLAPLLWVAAAMRFGWSWALPGYCFLFAALVKLTEIDLKELKLPNRITYPLFVLSIPLVAVASISEGGISAFGRSLGGSLAAFTFLFLLALIYPRGMGMGDVKLAPSLGLYLGLLGWGEVVLGLFLAFLLGALIGLGLIVTGVKGRKDYVPFGPFLALGTVIAVLWGEPILQWYTGG